MSSYSIKSSAKKNANEPACIILAAGKSQRFGSAKMQHLMPNGLTMLENTISIYTQVFNNLSVVIRSNDEFLKQLLKGYPLAVIESMNAEEGLSQSLISGVRAISNAKGVLIALGDMPYIRSSTLQALRHKIDTRSATDIVVMQMNGRLGNPVWFGDNYTQDLLNLTGDIGAKKVLNANFKSVNKLDVLDDGIFKDIDTPADFI